MLTSIDFGDLAANSSVSVTVEVKRLFDVPGDRVLGRQGDVAVLYPQPDDPSWLTGPNVIYRALR